MPPKGATAVEMTPVLTPTIPDPFAIDERATSIQCRIFQLHRHVHYRGRCRWPGSALNSGFSQAMSTDQPSVASSFT